MIKKICVLYNKANPKNVEIAEADEDTKNSAESVSGTLKSMQYEVELLGIDESEIEKVKSINADLVFNLVEWSGTSSHLGVQVIDLLQASGLAYTGSDAMGYMLSCDKKIMKQAMDQFGIPTPRWMAFEQDFKGLIRDFKYPVIVKPALEHCGIGISQQGVVKTEGELRIQVAQLVNKYHTTVIAEEFIIGRELQVTILERNGEPWVLPAAEITFEQKEGYWPILSYECKWRADAWEYQMADIKPANLNENIKDQIEKIAKKAYVNLGGRDYPRLDIRLRGNDIFVLEINNNPGIDFDPDSGITVSAVAAGLTYEGLLKNIVENAYRRKHDTN